MASTPALKRSDTIADSMPGALKKSRYYMKKCFARFLEIYSFYMHNAYIHVNIIYKYTLKKKKLLSLYNKTTVQVRLIYKNCSRKSLGK